MVFGALAFGFQISTTGVNKEEEGSKPLVKFDQFGI